MKKNYELLYILPASLTSEEIVKTFQEVNENLEKMHAKMLTTLLEHPFLTKTGMSKEEESEEIKAIPVVKRKLAYPIKHEKFAFYCLVNFEAEGKDIKEIEEYLKLNAKVLRHMVIVADPMTTEELEKLNELFARKKAEQEREEQEKINKKREGESEKNSSERERISKKQIEEKEEAVKEKTVEDKKEEIVEEEKKEDAKKADNEKEIVEEKTVEEKKEEVVEEVVEEEKKEKDTGKKTTKKSKIKLEDLEDKLDAILEDTIV